MLDNRGFKSVFGGKIDEAHPTLQPFRAYPKFETTPTLYQYIPLIAILGILFISGFIVSKLTKTFGSEANFAGAIAYVLAFRVFMILVPYLGFLAQRNQAAVDRIKMHAARGDRHVGIAYFDDIWYFRGDTSWDRGLLRIQDGCLCFRGLGPAFQLPLESIQETWIAVNGDNPTMLPRVFIRWNHPNGSPNVICLEVRDVKNRNDMFDQSEDLKRWIDFARTQERSTLANPILPFPSTSLSLRRTVSNQKAGPLDYILATLAGLGVLVLLVIVSVAATRWIKFDTSAFFFPGPLLILMAFLGTLQYRTKTS